jgi:MFS family permease
MDDQKVNQEVSWKSCTKSEICAENLTRNKFRPIKTEDEYFDNWVGKLDMLCKKKSEIGMIGACFFIGIMISMCWAPKFSDKYGRYPLAILTFTAQFAALVGLYFSHSIELTSFFMVFLGMSQPGKNIIYFNYLLEMVPAKYKQPFVTVIMTVGNCVIILICVAY